MLFAPYGMIASLYAILAWCPAQSERGSRCCSANTLSARRRKFEGQAKCLFKLFDSKQLIASPHHVLRILPSTLFP